MLRLYRRLALFVLKEGKQSAKRKRFVYILPARCLKRTPSPMPTYVCDAVLFDLDGVLIDSDLIYERHWQRWADAQNVSFEHIVAVHHGRPAVETIRLVAPHLDAERESKQFNATLAADRNLEGLRAYDGAEALLHSLPADRWAIATSAPRPVALSRLRHLDLPMPAVLVTADDVVNGKPAPDPYLQAAAGLGWSPAQCVVIEDAPAGIVAARAAGAQVIAVSSTNPPKALQAAAAIISRLTDLEMSTEDASLHIHWPDTA